MAEESERDRAKRKGEELARQLWEAFEKIMQGDRTDEEYVRDKAASQWKDRVSEAIWGPGSNWDTHEVKLWIDNDYATYKLAREAKSPEELAQVWLDPPRGSDLYRLQNDPDGGSDVHPNLVNWQHLYDEIQEEKLEEARYAEQQEARESRRRYQPDEAVEEIESTREPDDV